MLINDKIRDKKRFFVGSVLPDAYEGNLRIVTHFRRDFEMDGKKEKLTDYEEFFHQYADLIERDDLYLGYYIHLFEDSCYREFIKRSGMPERAYKDVETLHNDYYILNSYIMKKYHIENQLEYIEGFENEKINEITPFVLKEFLKEMKGDFVDQIEGKTVYLTEQMLDQFIDEYLDEIKYALKTVQEGLERIPSVKHYW